MDLRKLKTLIDLVQASGIAEIEINEEGDHVRIDVYKRQVLTEYRGALF